LAGWKVGHSRIARGRFPTFRFDLLLELLFG
jgi:hypothetical protein